MTCPATASLRPGPTHHLHAPLHRHPGRPRRRLGHQHRHGDQRHDRPRHAVDSTDTRPRCQPDPALTIVRRRPTRSTYDTRRRRHQLHLPGHQHRQRDPDRPFTVDDDKATRDLPGHGQPRARSTSITCTATYTDQPGRPRRRLGHQRRRRPPTARPPRRPTARPVTAVQSPALTIDKTGDAVDLRQRRRRHQLQLPGDQHRQRDPDRPFTVNDDKATVDLPGHGQPGARRVHHLHRHLHRHPGRPRRRLGRPTSPRRRIGHDRPRRPTPRP